MAEVIWNKQAENEWRKKMLYGLDEFGQTTAIRFVQRTNDTVKALILRQKLLSILSENILKQDYGSHYSVIRKKYTGTFI